MLVSGRPAFSMQDIKITAWALHGMAAFRCSVTGRSTRRDWMPAAASAMIGDPEHHLAPLSYLSLVESMYMYIGSQLLRRRRMIGSSAAFRSGLMYGVLC